MNSCAVDMPSGMVSATAAPGAGATALVSDEAYTKVRKPYTITKTRESWTEQEHDRFLEALQLFDRDWKKIEAFVGSKTVIQIRSHAQKYFLKVQKNGTGEHVPPPRPKRKSAQPYPQKASKIANVQQCFTTLPFSAVAQSESGYVSGSTTCSGFVPPAATNSMTSSWIHHTSNADLVTKDLNVVNASVGSHSSSSEGSSSANIQQQVLPSSKGGQNSHNQAVPDFAEIYKFLGNVFDPGVADHSKKLKEMAPIDRETVLLLMRNLCVNLLSSEFEEHKLFLSMYGANSMQSSGVTAGIQESSHLEGSVTHSCMEQLNGNFVPAGQVSCGSAIEASVEPQCQVQLTGAPLGLAEFVKSPQLSCNDFQANGIINVGTPFMPLPAPSSLLGGNTAISQVGWLTNGQGAVIQLG